MTVSECLVVWKSVNTKHRHTKRRTYASFAWTNNPFFFFLFSFSSFPSTFPKEHSLRGIDIFIVNIYLLRVVLSSHLALRTGHLRIQMVHLRARNRFHHPWKRTCTAKRKARSMRAGTQASIKRGHPYADEWVVRILQEVSLYLLRRSLIKGFYNYNFIGINYENTVQTRIRSREQTTLSAKQIAAAWHLPCVQSLSTPQSWAVTAAAK